MPIIEFTDAEIVHLQADAVRSPMVGPRLNAWKKIERAHREANPARRRRRGRLMGEIKVRYTRPDGSESKAYIEETTGVGTNKYTDEDVCLEWSTGQGWIVARTADTPESETK